MLTPHPRNLAALGWYAGCARRAFLMQGAAVTGACRPRLSLRMPSASVSLMPAAHLHILLNVSGAARRASASGSGSGSNGVRGATRTECPLTFAKWSTSTHDAAVGLRI